MTSQCFPNSIPTKSQADGLTAAGAEICGAEDIRTEDADTSEPLGKSREEPSGRADWTKDRTTFRADGREKCKPPKSGSEERKKKPLEEERAEDGHRVGRRVSEQRAVSPLVNGEFPKTAEEESRGLESLRIRVRGRVSEFAEIPSIVYVCVRVRYIYIRAHVVVFQAPPTKTTSLNHAILKPPQNHSQI